VDNEAISSIIDEGMSVAGDVSFKGKARVDGKIEGNVRGEYLILGECGIIIGDLDVEVVICQGRVDGNIKAKKLHAQQAAKISGSLDVVDLTVDSGASLSGDIKAHSKDLRVVEGTAPSTSTNVKIQEKEPEKAAAIK
jgi:cytoskeletal protein CcmA (bactofilin family)